MTSIQATLPMGPPSLSALLGLAAMLLGLSVAVQIIQEVYKFLTSSRARSFSNVLTDFVGPWSQLLTKDGPTSLFQVRGPLQFFKHRPGGFLLPAKKDDLLEAMDKIMGGWIRYSLAILKREVRLHGASARGLETVPSDAVQKLYRDLGAIDENAPGYADAKRIETLMAKYAIGKGVGGGGTLDAGLVVEAIYQEFFPERLTVDQHYDQLMANFKFAYERRNLRQTFVLAFFFAFAFSFPLDELYRQATRMTPQEAIDLAHQTEGLYQRVLESRKPPAGAGNSTAGAAAETPEESPTGQDLPASAGTDQAAGVTDLKVARGQLKEVIQILAKASHETAETTNADPSSFYLRGWKKLSTSGPGGILIYCFGCLATAVFISFGAPFWHRLTTALLSKAQPAASVPDDAVPAKREE